MDSLETQGRTRAWETRSDPWDFTFPDLGPLHEEVGECETPKPLGPLAEEVVNCFIPDEIQGFFKEPDFVQDPVPDSVPVVNVPVGAVLAPLVAKEEGKH